MWRVGRARLSGIYKRAMASVGVAVLLALLAALPERPPDVAGARAVFDAGVTLALAGTVIGLAGLLGQVALRLIAPGLDLDSLEAAVCSFALGMAAMAIGVFALGLAGVLTVLWIVVLLSGIPLLAGGVSSVPVWRSLPAVLRARLLSWRRDRPALLLAAALAFGLGGLALLLSLAPPWSYDALMYHLQAPRLFLSAGRITSLPSLLQANGPLLTQMLYAIGVAFGRDTFAQVVHAAFGLVLVLAVLAAGRRWISASGGWTAAAILVGIPIFPLWGVQAYADMTHALYEFLAVWGILRWSGDPRRGWLVLSALMAGFALGTKLMALYLVPALGIWLGVLALRRYGVNAWRTVAAYLVLVGLVVSPWYILNSIELGDPVYPFLRGGPEWPPERLRLLVDYVQSFGTGRGLIDFLILPWSLYARHARFATLMSSIEFPSFLFPLALLLPLVSASREVRPLGLFSVLRLATWFVGSQQIRFLLPLFPVLSVMTASVLVGLERRLRLSERLLRPSVIAVSGLTVTTLVYAGLFAWESGAARVVFGVETRSDYLSRMVYDYQAIVFLREALPPEARVLHLWDGQGYYCDDRCLPDAGQVQWAWLHGIGGGVDGVRRELVSRGITHLLLDLEGLGFMLSHDPRGTHLAAARFFLDEFQPACAQPVYQGAKVRIYELTCNDVGARSPGPSSAGEAFPSGA